MAEFDREAYVKDQVLELYRWSVQEHERRFCQPAFVWYRHYKNLIDLVVDVEDYHSNIGTGVAFPIIEMTNAKLMEPWLGGDQIIRAHGGAGQDDVTAARVGAWANDTLINRIPSSMSHMSMTKKSALIFGRGVAKWFMAAPRPRSTLQRSPIRIGQDIFPGGIRMGSRLDMAPPDTTKKFMIRYVDPFMWWMTPGFRFLEDADWTFEREYLTTSQCWEHVEAGDWKPGLTIDESGPGYDEYYRRRVEIQHDAIADPNTSSPYRRPHRKVEFQGRVQTKETAGSRPKYENLLCTLLDDDQVCKIVPLTTFDGMPSYVVWQPTLDPVNARPIGMIEPMEYQLLGLNDLANIILDNMRKIVESPLLLDPTMTEQETLYLGPGEVNKVRNPMMAVKALEMKDIPGSAFQFLGWFNDLIQRVSGVSDFFGGLNTSDTDRLTKTATGMSLMASLSASRFGPMLASMDRDLYRKLCNAMYLTARQRMTAPDMVRMPGIAGNPYAAVTPDDLEGDMAFSFNVKALDPSSQSKRDEYVAMIQQLIQLQPLLQQQGKALDVYEVARMLVEEFDRSGDVEKIIKDLQALAEQAQGGMPTGLPMVQGGGAMPGAGNVGMPGQPMLPGPSPVSPSMPQGTSIAALMARNPQPA